MVARRLDDAPRLVCAGVIGDRLEPLRCGAGLTLHLRDVDVGLEAPARPAEPELCPHRGIPVAESAGQAAGVLERTAGLLEPGDLPERPAVHDQQLETSCIGRAGQCEGPREEIGARDEVAAAERPRRGGAESLGRVLRELARPDLVVTELEQVRTCPFEVVAGHLVTRVPTRGQPAGVPLVQVRAHPLRYRCIGRFADEDVTEAIAVGVVR